MSPVLDPAALEHMLLYICREARALRRELAALAGELRADERGRFERTLTDIEARSQALLFALPEPVSVN